MSEHAVSALPGAETTGLVTIREMGLQGMVTLRADLAHDRTAGALKGVTGGDMPETRHIVAGPKGTAAWMAPDELLILCAHGEADGFVASFSEKLSDRHHLAVNVSDARAMFELNGDGGTLRDVLSKLTPADMGTLTPGEMRRTRLAQVPAAIWFEDDTTMRVICFRSVAQYVFDLLSMAAQEGGAVGFHRAP